MTKIILSEPLLLIGLVALLTTITASCIVFEVIGPILTKVALERSGECEQSW